MIQPDVTRLAVLGITTKELRTPSAVWESAPENRGRSGLGLAAKRNDMEAIGARDGCGQVGPLDNATGTPRYFNSNLIASCTQPDTDGPFDEVSGR